MAGHFLAKCFLQMIQTEANCRPLTGVHASNKTPQLRRLGLGGSCILHAGPAVPSMRMRTNSFHLSSRAESPLRAARRKSRDGGSTCPYCRQQKGSTVAAAAAREDVGAGEAGAAAWPKLAAAVRTRACQRNTAAAAGPTVVRRTIGTEIRKGKSGSLGVLCAV